MIPLSNTANTVALILIVYLGSAAAVAAQSRVPQLDLTATCRAADRRDFSLKVDTQRCLKTEDEARAKLADDWSKYTVADRDLCTQTARMGGVQSYVQLLTCLELQHEVLAIRRQGEPRNEPRIDADAPPLRDRPAGLRGR